MAQQQVTIGDLKAGNADNTWDDFDYVQGINEQKDKVDSAWSDFDVSQSKNAREEEDKGRQDTKDENAYEDDFEEQYDEQTKDDSAASTPRHASSEKLNQTDGDQRREKKSKKKHKRKAHKAPSHEPSNKPPPLNLYQDHVRRHNNTHSREKPPHRNFDIMSDQENVRRGRKLHRRGQIRKFHSMEAAVEQAGRDRLEQKFGELQELMARPLTDTRGVRIPRQRVKKMVVMQQAHASMGHRQDNGAIGPWFGGTVQEEEDENGDNAYSTIRVLQTAGPDLHMQVTYSSNNSASHAEPAHHKDSPRNHTRESRHDTRLASKPPRPRRRKGSVESSPTSSSGASQHRHDEDRQNESHRDQYYDDKFPYDDDDVSPRRVYLPIDMHLKYSDNPKLRDWLKRKNSEYRKQKKAERMKKKEERNEKMVEEELKIARREKSAERVKEWMEIKRKEAVIRQKEERRRRKQIAQQEAAHHASRSPSGGLKGKRIDRPASAPSTGNKKYIPIKRPDSAVKFDNGDGTGPKPPDSKFVYKRPVSGRVKLMKLQNERNERARSADQKRYEALSPEEKERQARLSYDAWLIAKRKEDKEKKKEAQRQKELTKSDPEMERIIPELAKKRIERIKSGKKRIDTGMRSIDDGANKSFGGGDFGQEEQGASKSAEDNVPKPSSYKLAVDGSAASLAEVNTRARPVSAKTRMPIPQSALSPRRPKSATSRSSTPKVKQVMDKDLSAEPNPYTIPFPDHLGVPDKVKRVQEKLFSEDLLSSANSKRPEPQGCASVETGGCPKGIDGVQPEPAPRSSMVLLQEIEAQAEKSEKDAQSSEAPEEQTADAPPPEEAAAEESQENLEEEKCVDEKEGDAEETQQAATEDDKAEDADDPDTFIELEAEDEDYDVEVERTGDQEEQVPAPDFSEDAQQESADSAPEAEPNCNDVEDDAARQADENQNDGDLQQSVDTDQSAEDLQKSVDLPSLSGDESEKDASQGDTDSSLRKSVTKHVSFSEDAPIVFKMEDPEMESPNFDDERGADDKEEESQYVSLDDMPDPE